MLNSLSKLLFIVSTAIIVSTVIAVLFVYQKFHDICICIPNKLAYAWILLSVTILFSIITLLLSGLYSENRYKKIIPVLVMIQSACFMAGLIFLVYFAARIIEVI